MNYKKKEIILVLVNKTLITNLDFVWGLLAF